MATAGPERTSTPVVVNGGAGVDFAARSAAKLMGNWIKYFRARPASVVMSAPRGLPRRPKRSAGRLTRDPPMGSFAGRLAEESRNVDVIPTRSRPNAPRRLWDCGGVTAERPWQLSLVEATTARGRAKPSRRLAGALYLRRPGAGRRGSRRRVWMPAGQEGQILRCRKRSESETGLARTASTPVARRAAMSPRHFTPGVQRRVRVRRPAYVERVRTEAARRQLEETATLFVAIASRCGSVTAEKHAAQLHSPGRAFPPDHYPKSFSPNR